MLVLLLLLWLQNASQKSRNRCFILWKFDIFVTRCLIVIVTVKVMVILTCFKVNINPLGPKNSFSRIRLYVSINVGSNVGWICSIFYIVRSYMTESVAHVILWDRTRLTDEVMREFSSFSRHGIKWHAKCFQLLMLLQRF